MNTCEKCGNSVPEEKAFCPNCGSPMIQERQRTPDAEEMGATMLGFNLPTQMPSLPKPPPPPPVKKAAPPPPKPTAPKPTPPAKQPETRKPAPRSAPADGDNRTLYLLLGVAAVLFALALLIVVIFYVSGRL